MHHTKKNAQIPFCPKHTLLIPSLLHLFFPQLLFNLLYAKMKEVIMSLEQDTNMAEEHTTSCFWACEKPSRISQNLKPVQPQLAQQDWTFSKKQSTTRISSSGAGIYACSRPSPWLSSTWLAGHIRKMVRVESVLEEEQTPRTNRQGSFVMAYLGTVTMETLKRNRNEFSWVWADMLC